MKIKNEKKALKMFCAEGDFTRKDIQKPYLINDGGRKVIATNAKVMIVVDAKLTRCSYTVASGLNRKYVPSIIAGDKQNIDKYIDFTVLDEAYNKFPLKKEVVSKDGLPETCPECDGTGRVEYEYRDLDGKMHYHETFCPVCNGCGKRNGYEMVETGKMILPDYAVLQFGEVKFDAEMIFKCVEGLRMMGFQGMTWKLSQIIGPSVFSVCDGVTLIIMPLYGCEKEVIVEIDV